MCAYQIQLISSGGKWTILKISNGPEIVCLRPSSTKYDPNEIIRRRRYRNGVCRRRVQKNLQNPLKFAGRKKIGRLIPSPVTTLLSVFDNILYQIYSKNHCKRHRAERNTAYNEQNKMKMRNL